MRENYWNWLKIEKLKTGLEKVSMCKDYFKANMDEIEITLRENGWNLLKNENWKVNTELEMEEIYRNYFKYS